MKKDTTTVDMFSASKPETKPRQEAPAIQHKVTYTPSDSVKGIPAYLERIREAIDCIKCRCDSGIRGKVFTKSQEAKLLGIAQELDAWLPELSRIRKDVDGLVSEAVHGKEAKGELEL